MKIYYSLFFALFAITTGIAQSSSNNQSLIHDPGESLSQRWLINDDTTKRFKIIPYKPVYFLVANYTTDINNTPTVSYTHLTLPTILLV